MTRHACQTARLHIPVGDGILSIWISVGLQHDFAIKIRKAYDINPPPEIRT